MRTFFVAFIIVAAITAYADDLEDLKAASLHYVTAMKTALGLSERLLAFLKSVPGERSGIMPTGYQCREYKNWRGIPEPRRCPFCKQAKGVEGAEWKGLEHTGDGGCLDM